MIVLDTHVLLWWLNGDSSVSSRVNVPLVTSDQKIRAYKHVRTLW